MIGCSRFLVFFQALLMAAAGLSGQEAGPGPAARPSFALAGGTVYPVAQAPIADGVVVVENGRIASVGPRGGTAIPDGMQVIDATGRAVIPGLVDVGSNLLVDPEDLEGLNPHAAVRIADAVDPFSALGRLARAEGITAAGLLPAANRSVGGLGMVVKLSDPGPGPGAASGPPVLKADAYLALALGVVPEGLGRQRSTTADRLNQYYQLRGQFLAAREYKKTWDAYWEAAAKYNREAEKWSQEHGGGGKPPAGDGDKPSAAPPGGKPPGAAGAEDPKPEEQKAEEKKEEAKPEEKKAAEKKPEPPKPPARPKTDLGKEVFLRALEGKLPILVTAHRRDDIGYAIRLKEEFALKLAVAGATEGYDRAAALHAAGVPAIIGPVLLSRWGLELMNHRESNAAELAAAGVPVAVSGIGALGLSARHLRLQAAVAVRGGLSPDLALRAVTLEPALRLGVSDRIGSIEPGKDADLVVIDGDPLSALSRVEKVFIDGKAVYLTGREF